MFRIEVKNLKRKSPFRFDIIIYFYRFINMMKFVKICKINIHYIKILSPILASRMKSSIFL